MSDPMDQPTLPGIPVAPAPAPRSEALVLSDRIVGVIGPVTDGAVVLRALSHVVAACCILQPVPLAVAEAFTERVVSLVGRREGLEPSTASGLPFMLSLEDITLAGMALEQAVQEIQNLVKICIPLRVSTRAAEGAAALAKCALKRLAEIQANASLNAGGDQ